MGAPDLVKALNNRGRVYVKLAMMECAETDATEVRCGVVWCTVAAEGGAVYPLGVDFSADFSTRKLWKYDRKRKKKTQRAPKEYSPPTL